MKNARLIVLFAALLPSVVASPLPEKAELLASNTVSAQYVGAMERPCYFRTALCPDRCDHAVKAVQFRVLSNDSYEKPGRYGDDKAEAGNMLMVDARKDVPGQPDGILQKLAELKPGQLVRLTQKHYYADLGNVMTPIRPVTELEVLNNGACEEIPSTPQDAAAPMPRRMPAGRMRR